MLQPRLQSGERLRLGFASGTKEAVVGKFVGPGIPNCLGIPIPEGPNTKKARTLGFYRGNLNGIIDMVWAKYSLFVDLDP